LIREDLKAFIKRRRVRYMGPWHRVSQLGDSFMVLLAMMFSLFVIMAMNELKRNE